MSDINFSEVVSVKFAGQKPRRMTLARAVREIIAIPQKILELPEVVLANQTALQDYGAIVALYARPDFPDDPRARRRRDF